MEVKQIAINFSFEEIEADLEKFSRVISALNKNYPLVEGVAPGLVSLLKHDGSSITITSTSFMLEELTNEGVEKSLNLLKSIVEDICEKFGIMKFSHFTFQVLGIKRAVSEKWERPLLKGVSIIIPDEVKDNLQAEDFRMGTRIVFKRNNRDYNIRVEPFFTDAKYNFFSFIVRNKEEVSINESLEIIEEEYTFLKEKIDIILQGG